MRLRSYFILLVILLSSLLVACTPRIDEDDPGAYRLRLLVLRGQNEDYLEPFQHFLNSMHANVQVAALPVESVKAKDMAAYDALYPDPAILDSAAWTDNFKQALMQYVEAGGHLFLESPFLEQLPAEFLGVAAWEAPAADTDYIYPLVDEDFTDLQEVYINFIGTMLQENLASPSEMLPQKAGRPAGATSLVNLGELSALAVNSHGAGSVTWASELLPDRSHISRLDFVPNSPEQEYFHYGIATANWLLRSKYLNLVAKQKYGFALEKIMGAYHRPALAWQNHFEVISAFTKGDIEAFTELLRDYRQVPTFSFIRGSFNWSHWAPSIAWLKNTGEEGQPRYAGMLADSFYGTGRRLTTADGRLLDLGRYQGFSSLLGTLHNPARAYPTLADLNGDGRPDLLVGIPQGQVYYFPDGAEAGEPVFEEQEELGIGSIAFAAPAAADLTGNGLYDLVVGSQGGELFVFHNTGSSSRPKFLHKETLRFNIGNYSAPFLTDFDGDGIVDLLLGMDDGSVYLVPGQSAAGGVRFGEPQLLLETGLKWVAPCAADWDQSGSLDLLVGSYSGQVDLYQKEGTWQHKGPLQGENRNFFGDHDITIGHNSVPLLVDWEGEGRPGLLLGGAEYGAPYAINDEANPHRPGILEGIRYLQENHLPILIHAYVHEYKSAAEEEEEIALHRQAFSDLGIQWEDMGVNHHTWRINEDARQTFLAQQAAGIYYNFGFHPYGALGQPRDGRSFLPFVAPYRLTLGEEAEPFLLWQPAPAVAKFPLAWESALKFNLPLTYFDHIENRLQAGTQERRNLEATIKDLARFQRQGNYSFMTEAQLAKNLFNHFYSELDIKIEAEGLTISAITDAVPAQAGEYKGANGVRFLPGAQLAAKELSTDSWLRYRVVKDFYVGIMDETKISWGQALPLPDLHIWASNSPLIIHSADEEEILLELASPGMQQLTLYSETDLVIEGEDLLIDREAEEDSPGGIYIITHYGEPCRLSISGFTRP